MTESRREAFRLLLSSQTGHPVDMQRAVIALAACRNEHERTLVRVAHVQARLAWLDWQSVTQRKWQGETRRPGRARHHDSIMIRERYVRCSR